MPRIEPTPDQMDAAFRSIRLADWPERLEDIDPDSARGRLVRLHAVLLAQGQDVNAGRRVVRRAAVQPPEPPHPAEPAQRRPQPRERSSAPPTPAGHPARPARHAQSGLFDPKSAAAGDRDD